MSAPFNLDSKSVLIDKLGQNRERFETSNTILPKKGLNAVLEIGKLRAELFDFAKNPSLGKDQLGPVKPKQPNITNLNEEEIEQAENEYNELMGLYEMEKKALAMQVPTADLFAIEQYLKPFDDTLHATPAIKGKRFHALTKQVTEEQTGFLGFGGKKQAPQ